MDHRAEAMPDADDDEPTLADEEELLPALQPLSLDDGEEETLALDDEIGRLLDPGPEEALSLDDSTGTADDDGLFQLELPPDAPPGAAVENDTLDDAALDEDSGLLAIDGADDNEYGYVDDDADDSAWEDDADLPELVPLGRDDGGEEGVDEVVDLGVEGDDGVPNLPPLSLSEDADLDEADDLLSDAEIRAMLERSEGDSAPEAAAASPTRASPATAAQTRSVPAALPEVTHLGPRDDDVRCVSLPPRLAGGTGLYTVGPSCRPAGLAAHRILSIALADGPEVLVGTAFEGLHRSDDGEHFERVDGWPDGAAYVLREHGVDRFWARSESGGLYRSDDAGRSWAGPLLLKPVVAMASPPTGGVVVLCAGRNVPPQLARSMDGGERWGAVNGPVLHALPPGAEWSLSAWGDVVAVAADTDDALVWVSDDRGRSWTRSPRTGGGAHALALVEEAGAPTLYAARDGVVWCVRQAPEGERSLLDVAERATALGIGPRGDGDGEARVHALGATVSANATVLWVASGVGLFRVDVEWGRGR